MFIVPPMSPLLSNKVIMVVIYLKVCDLRPWINMDAITIWFVRVYLYVFVCVHVRVRDVFTRTHLKIRCLANEPKKIEINTTDRRRWVYHHIQFCTNYMHLWTEVSGCKRLIYGLYFIFPSSIYRVWCLWIALIINLMNSGSKRYFRSTRDHGLEIVIFIIIWFLMASSSKNMACSFNSCIHNISVTTKKEKKTKNNTCIRILSNVGHLNLKIDMCLAISSQLSERLISYLPFKSLNS